MRETPVSYEVPKWLFLVGIIIVLSIGGAVWGAISGRGSTSTGTTVATRCRSVTASDLGNLSSGMEDGFIIRGAFVVESDDYADVDFVAAEIDGPGLEGDGHTGVWAVGGSLANPSVIMAINPLADANSVWPLGSTTDFNVTMGDDGASEARNCAAQ